jgi:hypothetical protein
MALSCPMYFVSKKIMPYVFSTYNINIMPRVSMPLLCVNLFIGQKICPLLVHVFVQPTCLILFNLVAL